MKPSPGQNEVRWSNSSCFGFRSAGTIAKDV
jgi:hypothetical protein